MAKQQVTRIEKASRLVAETYYGDRGKWLCDVFEAINEKYFFGELPYPHFVLELTPHGRCLAWGESTDELPPTIALHESIFGETEREDNSDIPREWLGKRFAFDALLHQCVHVSIDHRLGGWEGESSHNNPVWIEEVNRLAPMLGFKDVEAGMSKPGRVSIPGKFTKRGKPKTKVQRVTEGNVPFQAVATFPTGLRIHRKTAAQHYGRGRLPVKLASRTV